MTHDNYLSQLTIHIRQVLQDVVLGPIVKDDRILSSKIQKPRIRAQALLERLTSQLAKPNEADGSSLLSDTEVKRCAALIIAAFLNPIQVPWDYDRYAESERKRRSEKFFQKVHLGSITQPCIIVDSHGKILTWFLPALLLPARVDQLNQATLTLKGLLLKDLSNNKEKSWRNEGFVDQAEGTTFGAGKLSISVGRFAIGHKRLDHSIYPSSTLPLPTVQQWLQLIQPVEQLLDAVLYTIHLELWDANSSATQKLLQQLPSPGFCWPTVYSGMDVIVNRITPPHVDGGGAISFYDHLLSLGDGHSATFCLNDIDAEFPYKAGTSIFLAGRVFSHSVPLWSGGERVVLTHYSKDDVHERLGIPRPALPTQLNWWTRNGSGF